MRNFKGTMIVSDLDGTIMHGCEPCGENERYIRLFKENGGLFTLATGRNPAYIKKLCGVEPNCPVISHNGAMIWDFEKEKAIFSRTLDSGISDVIELVTGGGYAPRVDLNLFDHSHICTNSASIPTDIECYKAVIGVGTPEIADELRDELKKRFSDRYCIFKAWDTGVEVLPFGCNKGSAVKLLREYLGDRVKRLVCMGDHENDSFMLKIADIGYAVKNASAEAKLAADRVTVDYTDGAVKYIIEDLENDSF